MDHHVELVLEQDTSPENCAVGPQNCLLHRQGRRCQASKSSSTSCHHHLTFEWDSNLFPAGMNTESLILTRFSYFGTLTDISETGLLLIFLVCSKTWFGDKLKQSGKRQDCHQTTVTLILIEINYEKQSMCLQEVENHGTGCTTSISLAF